MRINLSGISPEQHQNLSSALAAYKKKSPISSDSPTALYLELTRNCPGSCPFCKNKPVDHPSFNMKDATFQNLLTNYIPLASRVDLHGCGESLILPNFHSYVNSIARLGPKISTTTTLGFGSKEALQSMIDNDVYISVSFDYAKKETYEKWRRGICYDTVIKNIDFITKQMAEKGTLDDHMRLCINPLQNANLDEVLGILAIAKQYGIKLVASGQLAAGRRNFNTLFWHQQKTISVLRKAVQYARSEGIRLQFMRPFFRRLRIKDKMISTCPHPWLYASVEYNGDFYYCDRCFCVGNIIGNVNLSNKQNLWNGPSMQQIRQDHATRLFRTTHPKCRVCYTEGRYSDLEYSMDSEFEEWLVDGKCIEPILERPHSFINRLSDWKR